MASYAPGTRLACYTLKLFFVHQPRSHAGQCLFTCPAKIVLQPPFAQTAAKAPACKNMHSTYASYRDARRRRSRTSPSTSFICFHVFLLLDHCQMYTSTKNSGDDAADSSCHLLNLRKVCTLDQLHDHHTLVRTHRCRARDEPYVGLRRSI